MKRIIRDLTLIVMLFIITACSNEKKITVNSCTNCAFSFYNGESSKRYGDEVLLKDFTYDYKELKTKTGEERKIFLGHILNKKKIERGFACGIENGKVFCIEGTRDGSKYEENVQILKSIFGSDNCQEDDYYIFCKNDIFAGTNKDGTANTGVNLDGVECNVISNGTMNCS